MTTCASRLGSDLPIEAPGRSELRGGLAELTARVGKGLAERFAARGAAVTPDVQNQRVDVLLTIPSSDDGREAREFRMSVFLLARIPAARGRRAGSPRYSVTPRVFAEVVRVENGVYGLETESESDVLSLINEILEVLPTCVPHP